MANEDNTRKKGRSEFLCKVAGVTYCNEDGESRQEIIKEIIDEYGDGEKWTGSGNLRVTKVETEYWEGSVIEVHVKGKMIGTVPERNKMDVAEHKRTQSGSVIVQLSYIPQHDVCSAKLYAPNRTLPTKKMEYAVEKILKQNPHLERPEKTFDAYRQFLNDYQGGVIDQTEYKVKSI